MSAIEDIDKLRKRIKTNNSRNYNQKNHKKKRSDGQHPRGSELTDSLL
jgi:hypothetical protein